METRTWRSGATSLGRREPIVQYKRFSERCATALAMRYIANLRSTMSSRVTGPVDARQTKLALLKLRCLEHEGSYGSEIAPVDARQTELALLKLAAWRRRNRTGPK